jgi:hypothetical protein
MTSTAGLKRFKELLQMRDIEVRGAMQIATKLRLTNQSRYSKVSAATAARNAQDSVVKPWEL